MSFCSCCVAAVKHRAADPSGAAPTTASALCWLCVRGVSTAALVVQLTRPRGDVPADASGLPSLHFCEHLKIKHIFLLYCLENPSFALHIWTQASETSSWTELRFQSSSNKSFSDHNVQRLCVLLFVINTSGAHFHFVVADKTGAFHLSAVNIQPASICSLPQCCFLLCCFQDSVAFTTLL